MYINYTQNMVPFTHVGFSSSSWGEQLWTKAARKDI